MVDKNDAKSDVKEAITAVTMQFSQDKPPSSKSRTDFEAETMNDYYEKLRLEPWVDLKYFSSHSPYSMVSPLLVRNRMGVFIMTIV